MGGSVQMNSPPILVVELRSPFPAIAANRSLALSTPHSRAGSLFVLELLVLARETLGRSPPSSSSASRMRRSPSASIPRLLCGAALRFRARLRKAHAAKHPPSRSAAALRLQAPRVCPHYRQAHPDRLDGES